MNDLREVNLDHNWVHHEEKTDRNRDGHLSYTLSIKPDRKRGKDPSGEDTHNDTEGNPSGEIGFENTEFLVSSFPFEYHCFFP